MHIEKIEILFDCGWHMRVHADGTIYDHQIGASPRTRSRKALLSAMRREARGWGYVTRNKPVTFDSYAWGE